LRIRHRPIPQPHQRQPAASSSRVAAFGSGWMFAHGPQESDAYAFGHPRARRPNPPPPNPRTPASSVARTMVHVGGGPRGPKTRLASEIRGRRNRAGRMGNIRRSNIEIGTRCAGRTGSGGTARTMRDSNFRDGSTTLTDIRSQRSAAAGARTRPQSRDRRATVVDMTGQAGGTSKAPISLGIATPMAPDRVQSAQSPQSRAGVNPPGAPRLCSRRKRLRCVSRR